MEKADVKAQEAQSDTSSVINMKEYAPSEYPGSEPPPVQSLVPITMSRKSHDRPTPNTPPSYVPGFLDYLFAYSLPFITAVYAYMKPKQNALRIARLAAFTIITSAFILGAFILAASWIQANTARNLDLTLNQELMDDLHPSYEHLVANEVLPEQQDNSVSQEEKKQDGQMDGQQQQDQQQGQQQDEQEISMQQVGGQEEKPTMELDAIANMLVQKGMRGNVNCIVEKRRNEELVDHAPRALNLPFGLNITTPPRLQHLTGEQVVIICKDDNEEKEADKEDQEQTLMFHPPPQLLNQIQQTPQIIPLEQILQHLPQPPQQQQQTFFVPQQQQQPQQHFFVPQQQEQQQQVFYHHQAPPQQPIYHQGPPQQPMYQQGPPQQPMYHQAPPQQPIYHQAPPQQPQQVFYPQQAQAQVQQQQQVFMPQPQMVFRQPQQQFPFPQPQQHQMPQPQQGPMPLREVPLRQMMRPRPINPMAIQDVPLSQMPLTHMPMREAPREERMQEQPIPVHHLVPPRPQQFRAENFGDDEPDIPAGLRERLIMMDRPRPRPLPLEMREPRLMRISPFPGEDNDLPQSPRFPPGRPFRFPDAVPKGMTITRVIPIRIEKDSEEDNGNDLEEKNIKNLPIPLNAILDMVFKGMRPFAGRQQFPMPVDIKIERIENKPMMGESSASEESQEEEADEEEESQGSQEREESRVEKPEDSSEAKVQQVEIVEKEGEDTHAIPIPADATDAQVFKLEDKSEESQWTGRSFLPNGQGRGGVFTIPQGVREAQIFTVSDARAGVPVGASFDVAPPKEEEPPRESRVMEMPSKIEGEVNLFPVPLHSSRLFPVNDEVPEKTQEPQSTEATEAPKMENGEQAEESRPHFVQPRSV